MHTPETCAALDCATTAGPFHAVAVGWRVWRAANRWDDDGRRRVELCTMAQGFDSFDDAANHAAEIESRAASRGDVLHLFVS